ncbi:hypothetical protein BST61_g3248 [Cercospora zeina]
MSQPNTSGLNQFVHRSGVPQYDGADEGKPQKRRSSKGKSADGYKVSKADVTQARVQANSQRARDGVNTQGSAPRTRSQARHDKAVYDDTDASNADLESASASIEPTKHTKVRQQHASTTMQDQGHRENDEIGSDLGEEDFHAHGENATGAAHRGQNGANPHPFAQHFMKGDSFPSTTSGRPSEVDPNDAPPKQPGHHPHSHVINVPVRGTTRARGSTTAPGLPGPQTTMPSQPGLGDPNLDGGDPWPKPSNTQPHSGFSYAPGPRLPQPQNLPHPQTMPRNPHNQHHVANQHVSIDHRQHPGMIYPAPVTQNQHHAVHEQAAINQRPGANYPATANPPGRGSYPPATLMPGEKQNDTRLSAKCNPQEPPQPPEGTGHDSEITDDAHNSTPPPEVKPIAMQNSRTTGYEQPSQHDLPPGSDHHFPGSADDNEMVEQHYGGPVERHTFEHYSEDAQVEDEPIDYNPEDLYKMSYAQLKAESFDTDPRKKIELPLDWQAKTLQEKLQMVMPFDGKTQAHFLEALNIDEWEEAGDWFLDRFGEVVRRLKESRRHKRKVASAFEEQIEQRSQAVSKKQKMTQGALDEMRESGGKVLQGTPKKSRKPKK